jgi:uncharacterized membrane protein
VTSVQDSVDVAVPVTTAYNQWTQFESFPEFMSGVEEVRQVTDTRTHWKTRIGGVEREFDAEITEQHPDERIAWRALEGVKQAGVVTFHRLDDQHTRVSLQLEYEPERVTEKAGSALGVVGHRVKGDLNKFKQFIESRGQETGAWRGDVPRPPQAGEVPGTPTGDQATDVGPSPTAGQPSGSQLPSGQRPLP